MKDRKKNRAGEREQSTYSVGGMVLFHMGAQGKFLCSCDI